MDMVTSLIIGAKIFLKDESVTETLCESAKELETICDRISGTPGGAAGYMDIDIDKIESLALPDAVWLAICGSRPRVYDYPLGEITQRAVKKTVLELIGRVNPLDGKIDEHLREKLAALMNPDCKEKILHIFITHYFFEICIDQLRKPFKGNKNDWCYRYHFSEYDQAVLPEDENKLRETLLRQCDEKASLFFEYLQKAIATAPTPRLEIRKGFRKIFGLSLPHVSKPVGSLSGLPFVNVAVGNDPGKITAPFTTMFHISGKCRMILVDHEKANVIPHDTLEHWLGKRLQPQVKDLMDIGAAVYLSDIHTQRLKDMGRKIGLLMPLRKIGTWEIFKNELEQAVSFLGRDDFKIYPVKHWEAGAEFKKQDAQSDEKCVCLFSGGLDSTAGAVWALENNLNPIFISHYSHNSLGSIQKLLIRRLYEKYDRSMLSMRITPATLNNLTRLSVPGPIVSALEKILWQRYMGDVDISIILNKTIGTTNAIRYSPVILKYSRELNYLSFLVSKPKNSAAHPNKVWRPLGSPLQSVMAQHLRSFLFLSLASAVALESGIKKIYVFENGPVALNPLFSEARVNTLTTHPHFLGYFENLINKLFDVEIRIENPFLYKSKGEVVEILSESRMKGSAALTDSCWNWFRVASIAKDESINWCRESHDGECVPCLIRRAAMHKAGLWDDDTKYLTDIFQEYPNLNMKIIEMIADYLRFCKNVNDFNIPDILHFAPDFSVYQNGVDCKKLIEMFKTHAGEISVCCRDKANDLFKQDLDAII